MKRFIGLSAWRRRPVEVYLATRSSCVRADGVVRLAEHDGKEQAIGALRDLARRVGRVHLFLSTAFVSLHGVTAIAGVRDEAERLAAAREILLAQDRLDQRSRVTMGGSVLDGHWYLASLDPNLSGALDELGSMGSEPAFIVPWWSAWRSRAHVLSQHAARMHAYADDDGVLSVVYQQDFIQSATKLIAEASELQLRLIQRHKLMLESDARVLEVRFSASRMANRDRTKESLLDAAETAYV